MQEGIQAITNNTDIEALRVILAQEQARDVAYTEAAEIGENLITLYELLAEDSP